MHILDPIPLPVLAAVTLIVVLFSIELGFRLGRWRRKHFGEEHDGTLGGIVAATLGLVAFLLALYVRNVGVPFRGPTGDPSR